MPGDKSILENFVPKFKLTWPQLLGKVMNLY